jgi:hypothetical protein
MITDLKVESDGLTLNCFANPGSGTCEWICQSDFSVPDGTYAVTFSAPGYKPDTAMIVIKNPTDCGCCGCGCSGGYNGRLALEPDGTTTGACCAALETDSANCGACGHACTTNSFCSAGLCLPLIAN